MWLDQQLIELMTKQINATIKIIGVNLNVSCTPN